MLGALSVTGVGIFGAQPAIRGQAFSWYDDKDRPQLLIAGLAGILGIIVIAYLIYRTAKLQASIRLTLSTLPSETRARIEANAASELPEGCHSIEQFITALKDTDARIRDLELRIARIRAKIPTASTEDGKAYEDVLTKFLATLAHLKVNQESYKAWEQKLIREAHDEALRNQLLGPPDKRWLVPATIAAVGITGLVFTLALAKPPASTPAAAAPELGELTRGLDEEASQNFWNSLQLSSCELDGRVPVLVLDKLDQATSVKTIAIAKGCEVKTFLVMPEAGTLHLPQAKEVDIKYVPASPTSSPTLTSPGTQRTP